MNAPSPQPLTPVPRPRVSAERGDLASTIKGLWPYIWPSDRADLRRRIVMATGILLLAKLVTVAIPYTFKWVTDSLVPADALHSGVSIAALAAAPIALTLIYGLARALMALLTQWRDASSPRFRCTPFVAWRSRSSSTCTNCPCASIWSERRGG